LNIMIDVIYRQQIQPSDADAISAIVKSSGFFSAEEINIAVELAQEKLELAGDSSYYFLFAEKSNQVIGYTCWGPIPATKDSFDLYWIAVRKDLCGRGLGKALLLETEKLISAAGGRRVYVDTSSRKQYQPTRNFYESCGYRQAAFLEEFYAQDDGKIIYLKILK